MDDGYIVTCRPEGGLDVEVAGFEGERATVGRFGPEFRLAGIRADDPTNVILIDLDRDAAEQVAALLSEATDVPWTAKPDDGQLVGDE